MAKKQKASQGTHEQLLVRFDSSNEKKRESFIEFIITYIKNTISPDFALSDLGDFWEKPLNSDNIRKFNSYIDKFQNWKTSADRERLTLKNREWFYFDFTGYVMPSKEIYFPLYKNNCSLSLRVRKDIENEYKDHSKINTILTFKKLHPNNIITEHNLEFLIDIKNYSPPEKYIREDIEPFFERHFISQNILQEMNASPNRKNYSQYQNLYIAQQKDFNNSINNILNELYSLSFSISNANKLNKGKDNNEISMDIEQIFQKIHTLSPVLTFNTLSLRFDLSEVKDTKLELNMDRTYNIDTKGKILGNKQYKVKPIDEIEIRIAKRKTGAFSKLDFHGNTLKKFDKISNYLTSNFNLEKTDSELKYQEILKKITG